MSLYLVTGGAGFIGSHIVSALAARGEDVRVLDDLSTGRRENLADLERVELVEGDLADPALCARAVRGAAGVFHEAAQVSVPRSVEAPERTAEVNVTGTLRLLEAAREAGVERVVFAASCAAYGDTETLPKLETMAPRPLSPYAAGKVAGEALMSAWGAAYGMRTVSLRYFNVFGPRQLDDNPYSGVIALFARALIEGRAPTIFGDGEQTRDFTYVDNVVSANLAAMGADLEPGVVINVGCGERVSINVLLRTLAELLGVEMPRAEHAPARAGDVRHSLASLERATALLGYRPAVDLRSGLARTLEWYRAQIGA